MRKLVRKLRRWTRRSEMLAVPDDRLDDWLGAVGLVSPIKNGETACEICKTSIDRENLELVSRCQDRIVVICSNPKCVQRFLVERRVDGQ